MVNQGEQYVLVANKKTIKTIERTDSNYVYFTDSSSTSFESFNKKFEKYSIDENKEDDMDRLEQLQRGISVGEPGGDTNIRRINADDPNAQIDYANQALVGVNQYGTPVDLTTAGLHPDTVRQIQEQQEQLKKQQHLQHNPGHDPAVASMFGVNPPPSIHNPQYQQQIPQYQSQLPKMKYTQKVVINLELNEMIPKIEDIKAVENVFDISVVEELAKEISTRLLSNPTILEGMIISELEKLTKKTKKVKPKLPTKPVTRNNNNEN